MLQIEELLKNQEPEEPSEGGASQETKITISRNKTVSHVMSVISCHAHIYLSHKVG